MIDYGGDMIAPLGSGDDRGYAKLLFCGNAVGRRFTSKGERYDEPVETLFGTGAGVAGKLDGALAKTHQADLGTCIRLLRGHAESISAANMGIDMGTRKRIHIIGEGDEFERPTLTFTAAGATWLLNTDSLIIENCNINLEPGAGAVNVAAPLTISGRGCGFRKCKFRVGTDANNKVTVGITWTGADGFMEGCTLNGATAATATTFLRLTGADRFRFEKSEIYAATTAAGVGVVQFLTTASVNVMFRDFAIANNLAASTAAVSGLAGSSGWARMGHLHVTNNNATDLTSAWGTKASVQFHQVGVTNDVGEVTTSLLPLSA